MMTFEAYEVAVSDEDLDDLRGRLERTRWPRGIDDQWQSGTDPGYLRELCEYWRTDYDWRTTEAAVNAWPQVTTTVDGQRVHLVHARSSVPGARPLLLLHGWPSAPLEFLGLLGPLTDPAKHGGTAEDAFHVVVPSLPGYAWSGPVTEAGWGVGRIAEALVEVMAGLGYERYGVGGGDWGSLIASRIAGAHPDRVDGLYLTMVVAPPVDGEPTPEEAALGAEFGAFLATETGYQAIQGTKPQTLAPALVDSPAGLAGWFVEKYRAWTDHDGDFERAVSRDQVLGLISTYWLTGTAGSAGRLYYEFALEQGSGTSAIRVEVPTGCGIFPKELYRCSRRQAEQVYQVRRWTRMERGGHFPALEQPDALVADIRGFFRDDAPERRS